MKTILITIAAMAMAIGASAQNTLTITVSRIEQQAGSLYVSLTDKALFMQDAVAGEIVAVDGKQAEVVFKNIADGDYAVMIFHDVNGNGQMDMEQLSDKIPAPVPVEPYGFSNNFATKSGPPTFDDLKFTVSGDTRISISMQKLNLKALRSRM